MSRITDARSRRASALRGTRRSKARRLRMTLLVCFCLTTTLAAQSLWLDNRDLLKPLADTWPTYSGDYSGRRFSALTQINQSNVKHLTLAWTARMPAGATITGGEGTDLSAAGGGATVKG